MSSINLFDIQSAYQSIEVKNAAGTALSIDASGFLTVKGDGNFTVVATNLDIRDLTSASDSVEIKTAAGQALAIDGSGFITSNINGTVTVSATNLDIRDLTHASDSVKVGDGTDFLAVNTDGSINVNTSAAGYSAWKVSNQSITTTESEIAGTPLANRASILIQNLGTKDIYLKDVTGVSTSNGLLVPKGGVYEADLDSAANIFAITGSSSSDVRVVEYAA